MIDLHVLLNVMMGNFAIIPVKLFCCAAEWFSCCLAFKVPFALFCSLNCGGWLRFEWLSFRFKLMTKTDETQMSYCGGSFQNISSISYCSSEFRVLSCKWNQSTHFILIIAITTGKLYLKVHYVTFFLVISHFGNPK